MAPNFFLLPSNTYIEYIYRTTLTMLELFRNMQLAERHRTRTFLLIYGSFV